MSFLKCQLLHPSSVRCVSSGKLTPNRPKGIVIIAI